MLILIQGILPTMSTHQNHTSKLPSHLGHPDNEMFRRECKVANVLLVVSGVTVVVLALALWV